MDDESQNSNAAWTIGRAFNWTRDYLASKEDKQARLSTEWLLADACGLSRLEVYTQFDKPLSPDERDILRESVRRRATGEPLQYIVGEVGFRYLTIKVHPGVLIPRPETEVLVDLALKSLPAQEEGRSLQVLDLCTGSGCIGLALASERSDVQVTATDICPKAVTLAQENAQINKLSDRFKAVEADLFLPKEYTAEQFDLIVSNPPYIPSAGMDELPKEVADFEPSLALCGGEDGLDIARRILSEAPKYLKESSRIILELDVRNAPLAADF
ncbi:MAG: peptide chain release factor N(5)-glutamine methyltransferase, partial [Coriobacteriia bacterium]|nr:peptide chain release factor N(5)-glutamine methyltransferase [Coriobacteriia bacterium]